MKIAVCVKAVPDAARRPADRPGDAAGSTAAASSRSRTSTCIRSRRRCGCATRRVAARSSSSRSGRRRRPRRCARRSRWAPTAPCSSATRPSPAPTSLDDGARARRRARRESADLVLFGQQSADGDGACLWAAVAELLRRPVDLAGRRARRSRRAPSSAGARPSSATSGSGRRCPPSSPSRTRSTSRATRR